MIIDDHTTTVGLPSGTSGARAQVGAITAHISVQSSGPVVLVDEPIDHQRVSIVRALERTGCRVVGPDRPGEASVVIVARSEPEALADAIGGHVSCGRQVVAVGVGADPAVASWLLSCGAAAALPRACTPARVLLAVRCVLAGDVVLAAEAAVHLFSRGSALGRPPTLDDVQRQWLERLACGVTMDALAVECGYSVRHMRRLIAGVIEALGAVTLAEAMALACDLGLVRARAGGVAAASPR